MVTPFVSVIIPVYNVERFFERCLRSLFEQTLENIEYIFVNDCTLDRSMEKLQQVLSDYPTRKAQVRIFNNEVNQGSGAARRIGLEHARGEYIIHCDSDDWVELDMYEKMYNKAIAENADIVCCNFWSEYLKGKTTSRYPYAFETADSIKELKYNGLYTALWNKLVRRSLYADNGILPFEGVNMWEDLGVTIRLRYFSKKTVILDEVLYHYNKLNENSIVSIPKESAIKEQIKCARDIEDFFRNQGVYDEYFLFIQSLKFDSKSNLFLAKSIRNVEQWRITFPETHRYIWKYTNLPINMRLGYWLVTFGLSRFAYALFDLKIRIHSFLRRG